MVNKKKEQFPDEEDKDKKDQKVEEKIEDEESSEQLDDNAVMEEPLEKKEIGEQMENEIQPHSHEELDQILIKLQEIEQRIATIEMGGEEPGMERTQEDIKDVPEREPDNTQTKPIQPMMDNPEKISKGESVKLSVTIDDKEKEEPKMEEPEDKPIVVPQQMDKKPMVEPEVEAPEEKPGFKKFGEQSEEDEDKDDEKKPKVEKELTQRQSLVSGNDKNLKNFKRSNEQEKKNAVHEFLKKNNILHRLTM